MTSFHTPAEDFSELYDEAPCGYVSITPRARIAMANQTIAEWLGVSRDELVGRHLHEILSFGGKIAFETHLAPMLRLQGEAQEIAFDLVTDEGEKLPVIGNAKEKRSANGDHLSTRLTLFKAVERRLFERSLIEAKIRAEEQLKTEHSQLELRDQFIAVLGHDLRNPLAAIEAGTRLLGQQVQTDERGKLIIDDMRASLERANSLIDDVLDFAMGRLGTGIQLDYSENARLDKVLSHVVHEIEAIHPEAEIRCEFGDLAQIECDPDRIAQLSSNLLSNAVKYGDGEQPVIFKATTAGNLFSLSVANRGEPIPEPTRQKLFQPFERGQVSQSKKGLGLGLFIANEIALAHGGSLQVTSTDDETRFTLTMPVKRPGESEPASS